MLEARKKALKQVGTALHEGSFPQPLKSLKATLGNPKQTKMSHTFLFPPKKKP